MTVPCGVCGHPFLPQGHDEHHSNVHTVAELAETKLAVDLAAKVLTVGVLMWMARTAIAT